MSQDIKPEVKTQDTFKLGKTSKEMNLKKKKIRAVAKSMELKEPKEEFHKGNDLPVL